MSLWDNLETIEAIMLAVAIRVPKSLIQTSQSALHLPAWVDLTAQPRVTCPHTPGGMSWVCWQRETCLDCAFTWLIFREDTQLNMIWKKTLKHKQSMSSSCHWERVQTCYQRTFAHAFLWSEDILMLVVVFALTCFLVYSTQLWMSFQRIQQFVFIIFHQNVCNKVLTFSADSGHLGCETITLKVKCNLGYL